MLNYFFIAIFFYLIFKLSRRFKINDHEFVPKKAWLYKLSIGQTILNYLGIVYLFLEFDSLEQLIQSAIDGSDNLPMTILIDYPFIALIWAISSVVTFRIAHNYYGIEIYTK